MSRRLTFLRGISLLRRAGFLSLALFAVASANYTLSVSRSMFDGKAARAITGFRVDVP